jgi:hypothetical protein
MTANRFKQAAPANVSTRVRFVGTQADERRSPDETMGKHRVRQFAGAACLAPYFGLSRNWKEYHEISLGTMQSGSPPGPPMTYTASS